MVDLNVKISSDGIIEFVLENADDKKTMFRNFTSIILSEEQGAL